MPVAAARRHQRRHRRRRRRPRLRRHVGVPDRGARRGRGRASSPSCGSRRSTALAAHAQPPGRRRAHPVGPRPGRRSTRTRSTGSRAAYPDADRRLAAVAAAGRPALPRPARRRRRSTSTRCSWCSTLRGDVDADRTAPGRRRRCSTGTRTCGRRSSPTATAQPVQVVAEHGATLPWTEVDLSALDDRRTATRARRDRWPRTGAASSTWPTPPLLRFTLVRTAPTTEYRLVVTNHHILLDGWSMPLLIRDLLALYATDGDAGGAAARPLLPRLPGVAAPRRTRGRRADAWAHARSPGVDEPTLLAPPDRGGAGDTVARRGAPSTLGEEQTDARCGRWPASAGSPLNTVVQAAWGIVLGAADRPRRRGVRRHRLRPAAAARRRRVDGRAVHQHRAGPGPPRPATRRSASCSSRVQAEQAALLDHHHLGLAEIQRAVGPGGRVRHADRVRVVSRSTGRGWPSDTDIAGHARRRRHEHRDATHYPLALVASADDAAAAASSSTSRTCSTRGAVDAIARPAAAGARRRRRRSRTCRWPQLRPARRGRDATELRAGARPPGGSPPDAAADASPTRRPRPTRRGRAGRAADARCPTASSTSGRTGWPGVLIARGRRAGDVRGAGDAAVGRVGARRCGRSPRPVRPSCRSTRTTRRTGSSTCSPTPARRRADRRRRTATGCPDRRRWLVARRPRVRSATVRRSPAAPVTDADRARAAAARPRRVRDLHLRLHRAAEGRRGHPPRARRTSPPSSATASRADATSRALHFASPSFDASVLEYLLAFGRGRDDGDRAARRSTAARNSRELLRARAGHPRASSPRRRWPPSIPTGLDDLRSASSSAARPCPPELVAALGARAGDCSTGTDRPRPPIVANISDPMVAGRAGHHRRPDPRRRASWCSTRGCGRCRSGSPGELYLAGRGAGPRLPRPRRG